jgi:agmatinase
MSDSPLPRDFDPGGAAAGDGLFGLPTSPKQSRVVVVPVPFEATVSYGDGTANGPAAVLAASHQVDLFDRRNGRPYEQGIAMLDLDEAAVVRQWSDDARDTAAPVIAAGGASGDAELVRRTVRVNELCEQMNDWVHARAAEWLDADKVVFTLGGDHSVPFGAIRAHAERHPGMGILHVDAHHDLRPAYEGFRWSHASILFNVLQEIPGVSTVAQAGIRDFSEEEARIAEEAGDRVHVHYDTEVKERLCNGEPFARIADEIVEPLPMDVYLTFDVDGLDPALCPGTGTPVPGGLAWHEVQALMQALVRSGRRIVGGDLVEVAPQPGDREWNANVGARLLYRMIGYTLRSRA